MPVKPVPEGFHTVTPYLTVDDAQIMIAFIEQALDGKVTYRMNDDKGKVRHAEMKVGDSMVMIGQARDEWHPEKANLVVYVPDCESIYQKALAAGGTVVRALETHPYGDRSGGVKDPQGNTWWISTHVEDIAPEEMERRMKAAAQ